MKQKLYSTLICVFVMLIYSCSKEIDGYKIEGFVEGFSDSTMLFLNNFDVEGYDTAYVVDGYFSFTGRVNHPTEIAITEERTVKDAAMIFLWIENSKIKIDGTRDDFANAKVTGSRPQEKQNILRDRCRPFIEKRTLLRNELNCESNQESRIKIEQELRTVVMQIDSIYIDFIKEYTNSYAAVSGLQFVKEMMPKDTLKMIYDKLDPEFKNSEYIRPIKVYLFSEMVKMNEKYIDFQLKTVDGKDFKLSDYVGHKYILLDFWSIFCNPCLSGNRFFVSKYPDFNDKLQIVGINLDDKPELVEKVLKEDGIKWITVMGVDGEANDLAVQYKLDGTPAYYLIDPKGKVILRREGFFPKHYDDIMEIVNAEK